MNFAHQTLLGRPPARREGVPCAARWEDLYGSSGFCQRTKNTKFKKKLNNVQEHNISKQVVFKCMNGAYLRAMLSTLVLLRMRCGCFVTEVEEGGGIADSVWTLERYIHI